MGLKDRVRGRRRWESGSKRNGRRAVNISISSGGGTESPASGGTTPDAERDHLANTLVLTSRGGCNLVPTQLARAWGL